MEINSGLDGTSRGKVKDLRLHSLRRADLLVINDPQPFDPDRRAESSPDNLITIEASLTPTDRILREVEKESKEWIHSGISSKSQEYNWYVIFFFFFYPNDVEKVSLKHLVNIIFKIHSFIEKKLSFTFFCKH